MWLAVPHSGVAIDDIAACFEPYRPAGWSAARAIDNLANKLDDHQFLHDIDAFVSPRPDGYDLGEAAEIARDVIAAVG